MMKIHQTLFCDLAKNYPDLSLVAYPGEYLDSGDTYNMLCMYGIPDEKIYVINQTNPKEKFQMYLKYAEKIFCDFYTENQKWLFHDQKLSKEFQDFIGKISWIEIAEEHKHISPNAFWAEPERNSKWVHPDVFQLFIKNRILI